MCKQTIVGAFVWVVNIVTPEKVCVDGAIVKIQSMPIGMLCIY